MGQKYNKIFLKIKRFNGAKKAITIWDFNVDDILISKLVETKKNIWLDI